MGEKDEICTDNKNNTTTSECHTKRMGATVNDTNVSTGFYMNNDAQNDHYTMKIEVPTLFFVSSGQLIVVFNHLVHLSKKVGAVL